MTAHESEFKMTDQTERLLIERELGDPLPEDTRSIDRVVLELLVAAVTFIVVVLTASAIIA